MSNDFSILLLFYSYSDHATPTESSSSHRSLGSFRCGGVGQLCEHSHDEATVSPVHLLHKTKNLIKIYVCF